MTSEPDAQAGVILTRRRRRSPRQVQESTEIRRAIVRNAVEFFARHGYARTTLQAVAERAGLTRTGLLHHFHSKEGLFMEAIEEGRHWADRQVRQPGAGAEGLAGIRALRAFLGSGGDAVHVRFVQTLQAEALYDDAPEHLAKYVRSRLDTVYAHVSQYLQEAHSNGEIGDADIPALATMITGAINGLQMQWLLLGESAGTGAALDALVDLLAGTAQHHSSDGGSQRL